MKNNVLHIDFHKNYFDSKVDTISSCQVNIAKVLLKMRNVNVIVF